MNTQDSPLLYHTWRVCHSDQLLCIIYFSASFFFNEKIVQGLHKMKNYCDAVICWYS